MSLFWRGLVRFLIHDPLLGQEFTVPDIRNAPCSTGCSSITLTSSWPSMRAVSRESTASFDPSSKMWSSAIWTAAILAAGLPASGVPPVLRSGLSCSLATLADFAPPAIRRGGRNGVSGCGRNFSWMFPTDRLSSPSSRCCASSLNTSAGSSGIFVRRLDRPSSNTSWPQPAQSLAPACWPSFSRSDRTLKNPFVEHESDHEISCGNNSLYFAWKISIDICT
jgi:hypothetical protein